MMSHILVTTALLLIVFLGSTLVALLGFEIGLKIGRWRTRQPDAESMAGARVITTGILSLLAFVLGFTFRLGTNHLDLRNQAVVNEAISIAVAYRRADLLPEAQRAEFRDLLRQYVSVRLEGPQSANVDRVIERLRGLHEQIWTVAVEKQNDGGSPPAALLQSVNDVIDVNGERVLTNMQARISYEVWIVLFVITLFSVAGAGYFSALSGTARRSFSALAYALVFGAMILMIVDVDVPRFGPFRESNQPLVDLLSRMHQTEP